jgi:hypothetical protein
MMAELAVLIPLWVGFPVLVPKELEGDALPLHLLVEVFHRWRASTIGGKGSLGEKDSLQGGVIEIRVKGPRQTGLPRPVQILSHSAVGDRATLGDLADAKPVLGVQPKNFNDFAHGQSPFCHRYLLHSK